MSMTNQEYKDFCDELEQMELDSEKDFCDELEQMELDSEHERLETEFYENQAREKDPIDR